MSVNGAYRERERGSVVGWMLGKSEGIIVGECGGIGKFCWDMSARMASVWIVATEENLAGLSVQH